MARTTASLNRFELEGTIIKLTETQLGVGAYGRVFEVEYAGTTCAAKEIHPIFFRVALQDDLDQIKKDFLRECQIWSTLRHPNIVQFMGMYYRENDDGNGWPVVVMEKMERSLCSFVDKSQGDKIQAATKLSILHDVSNGLCYLHMKNPPVVHRDLSPNNILLDSHLMAKITDLGVSKVMRDTDSAHHMTQVPGTPHFMPPEALDDNPVYGPSLDVFSYGAVVLYVDTQEWPKPRAREKHNPETRRRELVSEVERRQEYLDKMGDSEISFELIPLVISCLNDDPNARPVITEVSKNIKELKEHYFHQEVIVNPINNMTHDQQFIPAASLKVIDEDQDSIDSSFQNTKQIKWRDGAPAPVQLVPYSALYLNGLVYVGGHSMEISNAYKIYMFDLIKNSWLSSSIKTPYCSFAMVAMHNKLLIVGGTKRVKLFRRIKCTKKVLVLDETSCQWKAYSQMNTPRSGATAVGHKEMLIVTGGLCHRTSKIFSSTEVLDTTTSQWFSCSDLPLPHHYLQSVVVDNTLYLLGGVNQDGSSPQVFTAALDSLSCDHQLNWRPMTDTLWCFSSVVNLHGQILVIGGCRSKKDPLHTSNIYRLNKVTGTWEVTSQLPNARGAPAAVTISNDTIVIIGGTEMGHDLLQGNMTKTVWIGTME